MNAKQIAEIINDRAEECYKSARHHEGTHGDLFQIIGIVLTDPATQFRRVDETEEEPARKEAR